MARLSVRVQPGSSADEIKAFRDGVLVVRVSAPALEGRANRAACKLLAKRLGVPPSAVTVIRGERSRDKLIAVDGLEQEQLQRLVEHLDVP
jgi:uncharacterized protein (TIGR00251 family)